MYLNSTAVPPLTDRERITAVLHLRGTGRKPWGDRSIEWLYDVLRWAPAQSVHLNAVCREMRAAFGPDVRADAVVLRLLSRSPADAYLTWQREPDDVLVYVGAEPCAPALPRGQCPFLHGFQYLDWATNARESEPVPA